MALLNVRSPSNKIFLSIKKHISELKLDCMFLTETWLNSDGPAVLNEIPWFEHSTSQDKKSRRHSLFICYCSKL